MARIEGGGKVKLYHRNDHIVRFKNGDLWHFFPLKEKGIYLRCMKKGGGWRDAIELVANTHDHFSVSIDCHDHLHLIYQDYNGELIYMEYNGNRWNKQTLHRYDASAYVVQFPTVIAFDQQVHAIFAMRTIPFTGVWSLYHCYNKGNGWIIGEITRYTDGKQTSPFYLDHDRGNIHMVYRNLYHNQYRLFYCRFDGARNRWSIPENLSRNLADCNMPSILVKNDKLHLAWTSIKNSNLQVMYRSWSLNSYFKAGLEKVKLLSSQESNCSDPQLLWVDDLLWCIWYQNGDIYCCSSPDEGITWTQAKPLGWSHVDCCHCIKYSSNYPQDRLHLKMHRILANLENGLKIPIPGKPSGLFHDIHAVNMENLPGKSTVDQPCSEHSYPSQQVDAHSSSTKQNSTASLSAASQNSSHTPPEETLWKNPASAPPTTHREMDHLKPDNSQAAPQSSFDEANPSIHDAALNVAHYVADKKYSTPLPHAQRPETQLKGTSMEPGNTRPEHHRTYENAEQTTTDQALSDSTTNHVLALIQKMNRANELRTVVQGLLGKNQSEQDSVHYLCQLDIMLNSCIKKAEEIQAENQAIMREIDALRRRSIENQRQWEIFLEQFEAIKELLEKKLKTGFLRKIIG